MNECIFLSDRADLNLLPADLNRSTNDVEYSNLMCTMVVIEVEVLQTLLELLK